MADNIEKVIVIRTEGDDAIQDLEKVKKELDDISKAYISLGENIRKIGVESSKNINKNTDDVKKNKEEVKKATDTQREHTKSIRESGGAIGLLGETLGPTVMIFKDAADSIEEMGGSLKGLRGAIIATGLGALVLIVSELINNWDKWSGAIDGSTEKIKNLNTALTDLDTNYSRVTNSIDENIKMMELEGKSSEDIYNAKIKGYIQIDKELKKQLQAQQALYQVELSRDRDSAETEAARVKRNQIQTQILQNETRARITGAEYRKKIRDDEAADEQKKADEREKRREKAQEAIKKDNETAKSLSEKLADDLEDIEDDTEEKKIRRREQREIDAINKLLVSEEKKGQLIQQVREKYGKLSEQQANKENDQELKNIEDKNNKKLQFLQQFKEKEKNFNDAKTLEDVEKIKQHNLTLISEEEKEKLEEAERLKVSEEDKEKIRKAFSEQRLQVESDAKDASKKIGDEEVKHKKEMVQQITSALDSATQILGENTVAGKALAIASTTIKTYESAMAVFKGFQDYPQPFGLIAGIAGAGAAVLQGVATVKKIVSVKVPGKGGGGAAAGGITANVGAGSAPNFNIVGASSQNQLAETIATQQGEVTRTQVVSSEVTTQQALDRQNINNARFI